MAAISSLVLNVNDSIPAKDRRDDSDTPTTPRASRHQPAFAHESNVVGVKDQQPPPSSQPASHRAEQDASGKNHNQNADDDGRGRQDSGSMDIDDDDDDNDPHGSDNDAEAGEADSASKKKKGQRFFCTGYPPCNLSFTRSEHLARHIRKHTGERPFQCHCNRRFSRLDNLRQHAQTVHVNEEIPTDSLAATGTRFQRQIRTDRVRPSGRPRTGTTGSTGGHSRGHSRNLSTSSIGSTSSNYSVVTEAKRRPPPLLMAGDSVMRPSLGIEPPQTPPAQYHAYNPNSPGGMSTPTSANFSATPGSPGFMSSLGSPVSNSSRSGGFFGSRPTTRRLSVPSGPNPYQNQYPPAYPIYVNQMGPPSSHASSNSSVFASPTSTTFPLVPGQPVPSGDDWRRRTWHASTLTANFNYQRPATSGLTYSQTPDAPQPAHAQYATTAAGHAPRLPGIESFDHVQHRSYTPPRRQPSPMQGTEPSGDMQFSPPSRDLRFRSGHASWDGPGPSQYSDPHHQRDASHAAASWSQQAINEIHNAANIIREPSRDVNMGPSLSMGPPQQHQIPRELDAQSSHRQLKRQGWYNGPLPPARTSPEDSSSSDGVPTPGMTAVEVHPMIMHSNGYMEPQHSAIPHDGHQNVCLAPPPNLEAAYRQNATSFGSRTDGGGGGMNRLEALVAVATSEETSAR
ncbi:C2H2 finger domain transcription factor dvrA [Exophiala dermatitidis]